MRQRKRHPEKLPILVQDTPLRRKEKHHTSGFATCSEQKLAYLPPRVSEGWHSWRRGREGWYIWRLPYLPPTVSQEARCESVVNRCNLLDLVVIDAPRLASESGPRGKVREAGPVARVERLGLLGASDVGPAIRDHEEEEDQGQVGHEDLAPDEFFLLNFIDDQAVSKKQKHPACMR